VSIDADLLVTIAFAGLVAAFALAATAIVARARHRRGAERGRRADDI
jgi:hypothetical protein